MRILVVRLSALGDLVHTLPLVAALRRSYPDAVIDWLVDARFDEMVSLVPVVDHRFSVLRSGSAAWSSVWRVGRMLRRQRYDIAIDAQGLLKSAVAARLTGARRVIGFAASHLREPAARWFHTESVEAREAVHVVEKNLALAAHLGVPVTDREWEFPIAEHPSETVERTRQNLQLREGERFALLNPGAAWSSKRWAPKRYGLLAKRLWVDHRLKSAVAWGPEEQALARAVADASDGSATPTPRTNLADLVAHARAAAFVVAGDTGPLHLAAAVGTPVVGLYGPSDPQRNGPWSAADQVVSVYESCQCRQVRRGSRGVVVRQCTQSPSCLDDVVVDEVFAAIERRLGLLPNP